MDGVRHKTDSHVSKHNEYISSEQVWLLFWLHGQGSPLCGRDDLVKT